MKKEYLIALAMAPIVGMVGLFVACTALCNSAAEEGERKREAEAAAHRAKVASMEVVSPELDAFLLEWSENEPKAAAKYQHKVVVTAGYVVKVSTTLGNNHVRISNSGRIWGPAVICKVDQKTAIGLNVGDYMHVSAMNPSYSVRDVFFGDCAVFK